MNDYDRAFEAQRQLDAIEPEDYDDAEVRELIERMQTLTAEFAEAIADHTHYE